MGREYHLHLISDATGETLNTVAKAVCAQTALATVLSVSPVASDIRCKWYSRPMIHPKMTHSNQQICVTSRIRPNNNVPYPQCSQQGYPCRICMLRRN